MDTQNTPIHIHLWNKDFWKLALANLLLSISVYMMIPMTGRYTALHEFSPMTRGLIMGSTGIGLFLFGPFVNYLIQRYRRNQVCLYAMTAVAIIELLTMQVQSSRLLTGQHLVYSLIGLRILLGAAFGLSQMVMVSTLVIDLCESLHRTEANYALSWFGRFALSLGPLLVTMLYNASVAPQWIYYTAMAITFFSILLVNRIKLDSRRRCSPDWHRSFLSSERKVALPAPHIYYSHSRNSIDPSLNAPFLRHDDGWLFPFPVGREVRFC